MRAPEEGCARLRNAVIDDEVKRHLGRDHITQADILSVTELKLDGKGLLDISDLAEFTHLEKLETRDNCLTDLSPLSGLTCLRESYKGLRADSHRPDPWGHAGW